MAITLAEASKLSNDALLVGVIENIVKESPILQTLPFIEIVGNGLTYNREKTLPTVGWYDPNDPWNTSQPEFDQYTAGLKIIGTNADVDNFIRATRSNLQDVQGTVVELAAKAVRHEFEKTFVDGLGTVGAKDFTGLDVLMPNHDIWVQDTVYAVGDKCRKIAGFNGYEYEVTAIAGDFKSHATTEPVWPVVEGGTIVDDQVTWICNRSYLVSMGVNGATLTLAKLDELIDKVMGGKPDMILMSKRSKRKIADLARAAGIFLAVDHDSFGKQIDRYNGVAVEASDWVLDSYTQGTATGICSCIYAFQMGEGALCGLSSPGLLVAEKVGQLEGYDAMRTRIKWYVGMALFSKVKAARMIGVKE
jgi:hypothetical protein